MEINKLKVIQNSIRNPAQLVDMIEFVKNGGMFDEESIAKYEGTEPSYMSRMEIAMFEDGEHYIHNGHHRAMAILAAGRNELHKDEYRIVKWKYNDYNEICLEDDFGNWYGYVTPFDVRREARHEDFLEYKMKVKEIYEEIGKYAATWYIKAHPELYKGEKLIFDVEGLLKKYIDEEILNEA